MGTMLERGKPLDAVGVTGEVGKADFQPSGTVVHAAVEPFELKRRSPESRERYYAEKISELVLTQSQLGKVIAERDTLKAAIERIAGSGDADAAKIAREAMKRFQIGTAVKG